MLNPSPRPAPVTITVLPGPALSKYCMAASCFCSFLVAAVAFAVSMPALLFFSAAAAAFLQSPCCRYRIFCGFTAAALLQFPCCRCYFFVVPLPPQLLFCSFPAASAAFYSFPAAAAAFVVSLPALSLFCFFNTLNAPSPSPAAVSQ